MTNEKVAELDALFDALRTAKDGVDHAGASEDWAYAMQQAWPWLREAALRAPNPDWVSVPREWIERIANTPIRQVGAPEDLARLQVDAIRLLQTAAPVEDDPELGGQEQCHYCGKFYPIPVSYHHSTDECERDAAPHSPQTNPAPQQSINQSITDIGLLNRWKNPMDYPSQNSAWVSVPREPTQEMMDALGYYLIDFFERPKDYKRAAEVYAKLLAAAPHSPQTNPK